MSIELMTAVWKLDMPPTQKLVALSLADNANDAGDCWPSVSNICGRTSLAERTVQAAIRELEKARFLAIRVKSGSSNRYHLTPAAYAPPQQAHPAAAAPTPASPAPQPPQDMHPTPAAAAPRIIIEPSEEPSGNRQPVRELSGDFEEFAMANYPETAYRKNWPSAFAAARAIVGSGKASEADLRRRIVGYAAFCATGGASDSSKVATPQTWFAYRQQGEVYWARDWAPIPSKAQRAQDTNVSNSLTWLHQQEARDAAG